MTFKEQYQKELSQINFSENFQQETLLYLKNSTAKKEEKTIKKRPLTIAVAVIAAFLVLAFGASAVINLLSADDVAELLGEKQLISLFQNNDYAPKSVTNDIYTLTFLGKAEGEALFEIDENLAAKERTFVVWAIYRNDGSPLDSLNGIPLQMLPTVKGLRPSEIWEMGISASGLTKDGVLYYLFDYACLAEYPSSSVRFLAFEGFFPTAEIFTSDKNGETVYTDSYTGFKGIFTLG